MIFLALGSGGGKFLETSGSGKRINIKRRRVNFNKKTLCPVCQFTSCWFLLS